MLPRLELKEIISEASFDLLSMHPKAPFTQGYFYGEWQKNLGRAVKRFAVTSGSDVVCLFQLITYPLLRGKKYLYAPYGPVISSATQAGVRDNFAGEFSEKLLELLKEKLAEIARKENAVFVRLDFTPTPSAAQRELIEKKFKKAPLHTYHSAYFQPRTDLVLDLTKSHDELLKEMDPKTRYGLRTAEKRGIKIEIVETGIVAYFNDFYALMEETSRRNKFGLHPREYYEHIFENSEKQKNAYLVVARYEGKILVIDFILAFGVVANYVFSGSSTEHRRLCPSYLAQWEAILHAK
ncbi:MAG: peptidoglycan bridge formation glycyltransferase FemA/FemB family protein, partial [Patescibacteria group bacterium]